MNKPLSSDDILRALNGKVNLLTYIELQNYEDIDDALGPYEALVLLYETRKNFGHWVCVFKVDDNTIEHFDSYGLFPDEELKFVDENFRMVNYLPYPHLTALLYFSDYKIIYNEYQLQKYKKGVSTCGRWCIIRLLYKFIPQEAFAKFFLEYKNPDEVVVELTSNL